MGREGKRLNADDRARLQYAAGRRHVDPSRSLFGPSSLTWQVNREAVLLVGGGPALLLQVAHPLVAAGVAEHSNFRQQPLQRLQRTLDLTLTIAFADAAGALHAVRQIERVHSIVHGKLSAAVGPFPRGTPYDANDPALLFWVHATLVDRALYVYERFVRPLSASAKVRYYEESKVVARLFGISEDLIPPAWQDFRRYVRGMVRGPELAVGPESLEIAASILDPPLPPGVRHALRAAGFFTAGLLPATIRSRYGLTWNKRRERALRLFVAGVRATLPVWPAALRTFPQARKALRHHPELRASEPGTTPTGGF
jgi:uncharacterized protein (DUF2236 family)